MFVRKHNLLVIAGPCVVEGEDKCFAIAEKLVELFNPLPIDFVFKASFDKANRSSHESFRGIGLVKGLDILDCIKRELYTPILTDVHNEKEADIAATFVDILQIPAFLCRQTDLVTACGKTGKYVNVKKGQFMSAADMGNVVKKIEATGNNKIIITERGNSFGYNNLVADMRNMTWLKEHGYPVIFDATHSVQKPGGAGTASSGDAELAPSLACASIAAGADGVFIETHLNPSEALSDKDTMIAFDKMEQLVLQLSHIKEVVS